MKTIVPSFIVLLCIYSCLAQNGTSLTPVQSCKLSLRDSPGLQGYKLGMDISEVNTSQIAGRAGDINETYIKTVNNDSTSYLTFEFKKLKTITVLYKSLKFESLDPFVSYLNKTFNFPDMWIKQTPQQIEIEYKLAVYEEQLATVIALRNLMFQIHGRNCRQAKRMEREIPKIVRAEAKLLEKRQIGSRLYCDGFLVSAFIDNSIEKGVPAVHLFLPKKANRSVAK